MEGILWVIVIGSLAFVAYGLYFKLVKEKDLTPKSIKSSSSADSNIPPLPEYIQKALAENLLPDEAAKVTILGLDDSALIGTDRRVFIFKKGWLAGAAFGSKSASWDYKNLTGVQLETGAMTGVLALQGPGIISQDLSSWSFFNEGKTDAWATPHALVIGQTQLDPARQGVIRLRQIMSKAQQGNQLGDLEKLAELKAKGIITEAEFQAKKQQILNL